MSNGKPKRPVRDPAASSQPSEPASPATAAVAPPPATTTPAAAPQPAAEISEPVPAAIAAEPEQPAAPAAAAAQFEEAVAPAPVEAAANEAPAGADGPWNAFAEAQAAFARGAEEIAGEVSGLTRSGIAATTEAALALLGAKTLAEAVEINAGLARRGVDAMLEGSARLSEIGLKMMTEGALPILSRFGAAWSRAEAR